jgi:hypothetical protein
MSLVVLLTWLAENKLGNLCPLVYQVVLKSVAFNRPIALIRA